MSRVLLLDSDIIAYQVSAVNQESFDFGDTQIVDADEDKAKRDAEEAVIELVEKLNADEVVVCLTDPNAEWRKEYYPRYKAHRKPENKPVLLRAVKEHLASRYPSYTRPRLEADDVMGILSTHPKILSKFRERIVVSEDKDMRTVPGLLYNPNRPDQGVQEISELDADRFHMWQTIVGDPTDGYPGCPGIGKSSVFAQDIIFADREELWDEVLMAYASKGLTEEDAIVQARLARILRWYDFNYQTKKVRLWTPVLLFD
jgi:DNA polymerase-1